MSTPPAAAIWPGTVERLHAERLPTWAGTPSRRPAGSDLFAGIETERFYFVHSYGVRELADGRRIG